MSMAQDAHDGRMPARIIVVDDDTLLTDSLGFLLKQEGYDVTVACTASENLASRRTLERARLGVCKALGGDTSEIRAACHRDRTDDPPAAD